MKKMPASCEPNPPRPARRPTEPPTRSLNSLPQLRARIRASSLVQRKCTPLLRTSSHPPSSPRRVRSSSPRPSDADREGGRKTKRDRSKRESTRLVTVKCVWDGDMRLISAPTSVNVTQLGDLVAAEFERRPGQIKFRDQFDDLITISKGPPALRPPSPLSQFRLRSCPGVATRASSALSLFCGPHQYSGGLPQKRYPGWEGGFRPHPHAHASPRLTPSPLCPLCPVWI